jgi:hypothetical protein
MIFAIYYHIGIDQRALILHSPLFNAKKAKNQPLICAHPEIKTGTN